MAKVNIEYNEKLVEAAISLINYEKVTEEYNKISHKLSHKEDQKAYARWQSLRIKCDDLCKEYLESKGDVTYSLCVDYVEDYEDEDDEMGSRVLESLYIEKYGDVNNMEGQPEGLIFYDLTNGEIDQHLKNLLSFKKYIILDDNGLPKHEKETFDYEGNVFDAYDITPKEYLDYYNVSYELEYVNLTDDIT